MSQLEHRGYRDTLVASFFAGATNLLVSRWPVRDNVAAKLAVRVIQIANENSAEGRAMTLQQSAKEIRMDIRRDETELKWARPSAWAPFRLVVDGG